ncbi:MAG: oxidoreductase, partial [Planctomycetes bacterium GWF2_50_10]
MSASKDSNIGVIGAGLRSYLMKYAHKLGQGWRVSACADVRNEALDAFQTKFGKDVTVTNDYREILADPEIKAVFILSPDYCHEEHAVAALNAGKHVYLEKPMAITIDGCDRILKAAYKNNAKIYIGHNMRHMSFVLKMRELIGQGVIGKVKTAWCRHFISYGGDAYFKDWHAERAKSTGLLLQKAAHDIDVMHWFCRGYTRQVVGFGDLTLYDQISDRHSPSEPGDASWSAENWPPLSLKQLNPVIDVEDISLMLMRFDNGVLGSYQQCHFAPDAWRNYCVIGTHGRIENFGDEPGKCVIKLWNRRSGYNPDGDEQFVISEEDGGHGGADPKIVAEFLNYIENG